MPISVLFQSTLPRRERPETNRNYMRTCINFNPHSHEGSDGYCSNTAVISSSISIPTPTKGATDLMQSGTLLTIFQSTLPRRERLSGVGKTTINDIISIHTPTKGATSLHLILHPSYLNFNPHSHKGSDKLYKHPEDFILNFNPHSHKGSDDH